MSLKAVEYVISKDLFSRIGLTEQAAAMVKDSWSREEVSIYGRFDFSYDGKGEPKLLEYNADTPTALYEASIAQWVWLEELYPKYDQFNSIHEKLIDAFNAVKCKMPIVSRLYFSSVKDHEEDLVTVEYMRDVAGQVGIETQHIYVEDIGRNPDIEKFLDLDDEVIGFMFKLYPWEWLAGPMNLANISSLRPLPCSSRHGRWCSRAKGFCPCCGRCSPDIKIYCRALSSNPGWATVLSKNRSLRAREQILNAACMSY